MLKYKMQVFDVKTENGIMFVAKYPVLKGVSGTGDTPAKAVDELIESAQVFIDFLLEEGMKVPESDFNSDKEFSGNLTIRIPKRLHRALSDVSTEEDTSINQIIVSAVSAYVTREQLRIDFEEVKDRNLVNPDVKSYGNQYSNKVYMNYAKDPLHKAGGLT